jgi:hypothetical protein
LVVGTEGEPEGPGVIVGVGTLSTDGGATRVRSKAEIRAECIGGLRVRNCQGCDCG